MRHAIYFTPDQDHPLTRAARRWLGRDAFSGAAIEQPQAPSLSAEELRALTADPRRYGFHATIKAPFRLAPGKRESELDRALADFAATFEPFALPLLLTLVDGFFALTPAEASPRLQRLADETVAAFDVFRAPLMPDERSRRRPDRLTEQQLANLDRWGYPYVFEQFGFHMTLTERVAPADQPRIAGTLEQHFAGLLRRPVEIDSLALFVEPVPGAPFMVRSRHMLGAGA